MEKSKVEFKEELDVDNRTRFLVASLARMLNVQVGDDRKTLETENFVEVVRENLILDL